MADALKMSQTGCSKIERGETDITINRLQQIAKILNMNIKI